MIDPRAAVVSVHDPGGAVALGALVGFRQGFYGCLTARADALFELADAVLCTDGPVRSLVGLSLAPEHRRGHGALYDGINHGRIDIARLRNLVAGQRLPRAAALETGRTSWTALLDAVRLMPGADVAAVTTAQIREVVERLIAAGQWQPGDPDILVVLDAGYDAPRMAHLLADLPVEILGRMRSDRVLHRPVPPRVSGTGGRPPKHGGEFVFGDLTTWGAQQAVTSTNTRLYGTATAQAWNRLHPR